MLKILRFPDPGLFRKAVPVQTFDEELGEIALQMREAMYASRGVGLSGTQVDIHRRIIVLDEPDDEAGFKVLINPEIVWREDEEVGFDEGCLSFPSLYVEVNRANRIRVRAHDLLGNEFEILAEGSLSQCIQHEIDHLDGKVFVDHLSPARRNRALLKFSKLSKLR